LVYDFFIVIAGALFIVLSANYAVKSCVRLARHFGLSDELIGMTILSIGTSLPEIVTHIVGSIQILANPLQMDSLSGLVIGTNIGSDIFQQNFIISLIALIAVIKVQDKHLKKDMGGLIGAALLVWLFSYNGIIHQLEGAILFFGYIAYLIILEKYGMRSRESINDGLMNHHPVKHTFIAIVSFLIMALAADRVLEHSTFIVDQLNISASFFGVIVLGIVTALPELTTSLVALRKKKVAMSVGILIGSNITNPMFALGLGAMISSYTVPQSVIVFDLPFKIGTALLLFYFLWKDKSLKKGKAALLMVLYFAYLFLRNLWFPVDII